MRTGDAEAGGDGLVIDFTHMHRPVTGIERVTEDVFGEGSFSGLAVERVQAQRGALGMAFAQTFRLPRMLKRRPHAVFVFPGFPPHRAFLQAPERTFLYVHDLFLLQRDEELNFRFLLQRDEELNFRARLYLRPRFRSAIGGLRRFFVNSIKTEGELRAAAPPDAEIGVLRPRASNVFDLSPGDRAARPDRPDRIDIVAIGTLEPRKNFAHAADIRDALERRLGVPVQLHIIGRYGWGGVRETLVARPGVTLHGYLPPEQARAVIERADIFLAVSRDEGLGLPLLEAAHGGLPIASVDCPVFREVTGGKAIFLPEGRPDSAAECLAEVVSDPGWRKRGVEGAAGALAGWSRLAAADRDRARERLCEALRTAAAGSGPR